MIILLQKYLNAKDEVKDSGMTYEKFKEMHEYEELRNYFINRERFGPSCYSSVNEGYFSPFGESGPLVLPNERRLSRAKQ
mmetsp:Transcript_1948/g.1861  ORF Transcript_1948/g.1861 Transcript_1948/m.1861 type:complete len:80 (+) Transcript_1948:1323-1562(+)